MVLTIVILGIICLVYIAGDAQRKQKMRSVGKGIFSVGKDVIHDAITFVQNLIKKIKKMRTNKNRKF